MQFTTFGLTSENHGQSLVPHCTLDTWELTNRRVMLRCELPLPPPPPPPTSLPVFQRDSHSRILCTLCCSHIQIHTYDSGIAPALFSQYRAVPDPSTHTLRSTVHPRPLSSWCFFPSFIFPSSSASFSSSSPKRNSGSHLFTFYLSQ